MGDGQYVVNLYNDGKKKRNNYVDNKRLLEELIVYREACRIAAEAGRERPRAPNYVGEAILAICSRLAIRKNFSGYTYKDEMIEDAVIDCVSAIKNFDPEKSKYPFTYFSKIAYFAFIRRIKEEQKESYVKHSGINNLLAEGMTEMELAALGYSRNEAVERFMESYESKIKRKKKK